MIPNKFLRFFSRHYSRMESDLSHIEVKNPTDPAILLHEWTDEAKKCGKPPFLMNLATATRDGEVSNRNVVIKEILPDASLTFAAQDHSIKIQNIKENPRVAASILLSYVHKNENIKRQINVMGKAVQLPQEKCKSYFEEHQLSAKIRMIISQDCAPIEWNDLKQRHDAILKEVTENGKVLQMPDSMVAYKIVPFKMDFYFSCGNKIGDRILFGKDENEQWKFQRVAP